MSEPPVSAHVALDWDSASYQLPLEAYSMTPQERGVAWAAYNIVWIRCVTGSDNVPAAELARSQTMAATPDVINAPNWDLGVWDAPYVAAHGWFRWPGGDAETFAPGGPKDVSEDTRNKCSSSPELLAVTPTAIRSTIGADTAFSALSSYSTDAREYTLRDSRYQAAAQTYKTCLEAGGYSIAKGGQGDDYVITDVQQAGNWTDEQAQAAKVFAATCNDDQGLTQRLVDINAAYEHAIIDQHEAELVAMRTEVGKRVEAAHQTLRDVGLE